jgi:capsular polysaccharide biosynthesis protein
MNEVKKSDFNTTNFLLFLLKWWKPLVIVTFASAIASAGFSFLIQPKYKSTVVLFPTSTNAISKAILADNFGVKQDILEFGEEEQAEQIL